MPEKYDRTAESHAGVLGQKNNFFSSFTYTGWGGVILCLRNTIEQLKGTIIICFFFYIHRMVGELHYA